MDHHEKTVRSGEKAGVGGRLSHFLQKTVAHPALRAAENIQEPFMSGSGSG